MTDIIDSVVPTADNRTERAEKAVKAFRALQPTLTSYARVYSGNKNLRVEISSKSARTDGNKIYFRPPLELGDLTPHVRKLCDKRDDKGKLLCNACSIREFVIIQIYHEIAHVSEGTFDRPRAGSLEDAIVRAVDEAGGRYADKIAERIKNTPERYRNSYMALSGLISPFLPVIINALEDARVNNNMFTARRGTKPMFEALMNKILAEGVEQKDPITGEVTVKYWRDYALNAQIATGVFLKAAGHEYKDWFQPVVEEALEDEALSELLAKTIKCRHSGETYELAFPILARLRELGFCKSEKDPEPEPEPEQEQESEQEPEEQDGSGDSDESEVSSGDSSSEDSDGEGDELQENPDDRDGESDSSGDPEADQDGGSDDTDGDAEEDATDQDDGSGAGSEQESDELDSERDNDDETGSSDSDGGSSSEGDESSVDGDLNEDDRSDSSEASDGPEEQEQPSDEVPSDSDESSGDDADGSESELDDSASGSSDGDDSAGSDGDELDRNDDLSESGEDADDDSDESLGSESGSDESGNLLDRPEPDGDDQGSDDDLRQSQDDADSRSDGDNEEVDPVDSGADEGKGGTQLVIPEDLEMGEADDVLKRLLELQGHGDPPEEVEAVEEDRKELERAIIQGMYFETPSSSIVGVRVNHRGKVDSESRAKIANAWDRYDESDDEDVLIEYGVTGEFDPDETTLGPALLHMRKVFADNRRGHNQRNLKSGKINNKVLGKRVAVEDPRMFRHRSMPGKKDYAVLIGMDISGSTVGVNLVLEKRAVMAQANLLQRTGIKFAIVAHSGVSLGQFWNSERGIELDVYVIKDFNDPWSNDTKNNLRNIGPYAVNLDGHALEYLRKMVDREIATDKIIMYYSDGKMPAENHDEELEILQREIRVCKQRNIKLLGVGIRTDSPSRHGLDTVQVDDDGDIIRVVKHLEKHLT